MSSLRGRAVTARDLVAEGALLGEAICGTGAVQMGVDTRPAILLNIVRVAGETSGFGAVA